MAMAAGFVTLDGLSIMMTLLAMMGRRVHGLPRVHFLSVAKLDAEDLD
jgi:hypothetical protein